jgi:hypothetical protein
LNIADDPEHGSAMSTLRNPSAGKGSKDFVT